MYDGQHFSLQISLLARKHVEVELDQVVEGEAAHLTRTAWEEAWPVKNRK